tara:strand:+ start:93 stop:446 length:354 start_codon:yes stop_codon:yes gene_type:complete
MSLHSKSLKEVKTILHEIAKSHESGIMRIVATDALDSESPLDYLQDVTNYGCISGSVSGLIYYVDTHAFFDNHYEEIEAMRYDWEDQTGTKLYPNGDLKNWYAWFAYERKCSELLDG